MNFKSAISKFLTNKWVLNVVSIVAVFNVLGFIVMDNFNSLVYFTVLALAVAYFSKNMIIVLGVPLILVNFANVAQNKSNTEGMTNKPDEHSKVINKLNNDKRKLEQATLPGTDAEDAGATPSNVKTDESFEVGRAKKKGGYDIDYATTVEDAYDDLNKILGSDGIKQLTDDTQNLMKQQLQLAQSMEGMAPLIKGMAPMLEQAKSILGGMGDGKEGLGNIMEIAKKFTSGAK